MCMRNTYLPLANCSKLLIGICFFRCPRIWHHCVCKFCCLWESHGLNINEERLSTSHGSCLFLIILSIRLQSVHLLAQILIKLAPGFFLALAPCSISSPKCLYFWPLAILCYFYCSAFHQIRKGKEAFRWQHDGQHVGMCQHVWKSVFYCGDIIHHSVWQLFLCLWTLIKMYVIYNDTDVCTETGNDLQSGTWINHAPLCIDSFLYPYNILAQHQIWCWHFTVNTCYIFCHMFLCNIIRDGGFSLSAASVLLGPLRSNTVEHCTKIATWLQAGK